VVAAGDALLAPSVTRRLIGEFARTAPSGGAVSAGAAGSGAACAGAAAGGPVRGGAGWDGAAVARDGGIGRDGLARGVVSDVAARTSGRLGAICSADQLARVLTDRELEVLSMVARGLSNGEIAEQLTISPATAKTHVAHLLTKLDSRDRIQLVIIAYRCGLVTTVQ
jgi:DNA-binding CsgD family transcriptional regulator